MIISIKARFIFAAVVASNLCSCSTVPQISPNPYTHREYSTADKKNGHRQIEIFFDGTANEWRARTNVRRRFEMVAWVEDPMWPCCYIEGVGSRPRDVIGKVFGQGMKSRVLQGYEFLARIWQPGDKIYIYGFSRGAFEARVLAGLMAHCGLPDATNGKMSVGELSKTSDRVWKFCTETLKDPAGEPSTDVWERALAANRSATAQLFTSSHIQFHSPEVNFLALWDTVPGLQFTHLTEYGEGRPDRPQRYKVRPYPTIKVIAQALALDECRSKFSPLLVGPPIDKDATHVYEVWFPGAHSDIGGGYEDSNDMAGVSFNWVFNVMKKENLGNRAIDKMFGQDKHPAYPDPQGIIHHPENDFPGNFGSHEDRRKLTKGAMLDESAFTRAGGGGHPAATTSPGVYAQEVYAPKIPVITGDPTRNVVYVQLKPVKPSEGRQAILSPWLVLNQAEGDKTSGASRLKGPALTIEKMQVKQVKTTEKPATSSAEPGLIKKIFPTSATPQSSPAN